jgi:hypothetical protein
MSTRTANGGVTRLEEVHNGKWKTLTNTSLIAGPRRVCYSVTLATLQPRSNSALTSNTVVTCRHLLVSIHCFN